MLDETGVERRVRVHDQYGMPRPHLGQQSLEHLVERARLLVAVADRLDHLGAVRACDVRGPVGAVVRDHDDAVGPAPLAVQGRDRFGDLVLFVVRRDQHGDVHARGVDLRKVPLAVGALHGPAPAPTGRGEDARTNRRGRGSGMPGIGDVAAPDLRRPGQIFRLNQSNRPDHRKQPYLGNNFQKVTRVTGVPACHESDI
ncbi:hypothetical protein OG913_31790 [Microbispora hainanensis]|uniref:Uncharacterized protein n=1 Tax=Microbispora hainanensis TaxID=568844 RepID=A0ABZ1SLN4_9ACTN|nr:hypothetical protein [Microbispora hainanensis]